MLRRLDERETPCSECGLFEACDECTAQGGDYEDEDEDEDEDEGPLGVGYPDDQLRYCHDCKSWEFGPHQEEYDE